MFFAAFASAKIRALARLGGGIFVGFLFGYFAFFIASNFLKTPELQFFANIALIVLLIALFILSCLKFELVNTRISLIALAAFAFAVKYFILSQDFPIFTSSLLDSQAVICGAFIFLAFLLCLILFIFLRFIFTQSPKFSLFLLFLMLFCELNNAAANILLTAMREKLIETDATLLSYVAKSLYYTDFANFTALFFVLILSFLCLKKRSTNLQKSGLFDIKFRQNEARNSRINSYFTDSFVSVVLAFCVILHFNLIASKPISRSEAKEITPNSSGVFEFSMEMLRDNDLHRFAYITSEGKVVRFFLINKIPDKDAPVAVFDACMLCGDMGYAKRGGEIICISCNVRIFLLSVGKEGGCNPIPLKFDFDGEFIRINLADVVAGSGYFSEVKEIAVIDPVSKEKLINSRAEASYNYNGLTYYFKSQENYEKFKENPEIFLDHNLSAKFRVQGY